MLPLSRNESGIQELTITNQTSKWNPHDLIRQLHLHDPSPELFALEWWIFAMAALTRYHIRRNDERYQIYFVTFFILCSFVAGALQSESELLVFLGRFLPSFVIFGLFMSAFAHRLGLGGCGDDDRIREQDGYARHRVDTLEKDEIDEDGFREKKTGDEEAGKQ
jgi:hypothetical protein